MLITFRCPCGEALEVEPRYAGMDVQCPTCQKVVVAPAAKPTVVKPVSSRPGSGSRAGLGTPTKQPLKPQIADDDDDEDRPRKRRRIVDDEDDEDDRPRKRRPRDDEEDEEDEDDRPRKRKKKPKADGPFAMEQRIFNGSVVGGAIAMLIAVVWFVIGLFAGWVFFYPPILFIVGLIGFIKGLVSPSEE